MYDVDVTWLINKKVPPLTGSGAAAGGWTKGTYFETRLGHDAEQQPAPKVRAAGSVVGMCLSFVPALGAPHNDTRRNEKSTWDRGN
jgi:hypothetical protein